jgi:Membrane-associated lipoprotein involved in thiamine biosynthesis
MPGDTGLMVLGPEKAKEVVREQGLAVYMIMKEGDNFTTWMSPQFKAFLVNGKIKKQDCRFFAVSSRAKSSYTYWRSLI